MYIRASFNVVGEEAELELTGDQALFLFVYFFTSLLLWLEKEKITPDTFI